MRILARDVWNLLSTRVLLDKLRSGHQRSIPIDEHSSIDAFGLTDHWRGFAQWTVVYAEVGSTVFFITRVGSRALFFFSFSIFFYTFGVLRKYLFPKGL
jgi:hypothetical protein